MRDNNLRVRCQNTHASRALFASYEGEGRLHSGKGCAVFQQCRCKPGAVQWLAARSPAQHSAAHRTLSSTPQPPRWAALRAALPPWRQRGRCRYRQTGGSRRCWPPWRAAPGSQLPATRLMGGSHERRRGGKPSEAPRVQGARCRHYTRALHWAEQARQAVVQQRRQLQQQRKHPQAHRPPAWAPPRVALTAQRAQQAMVHGQCQHLGLLNPNARPDSIILPCHAMPCMRAIPGRAMQLTHPPADWPGGRTSGAAPLGQSQRSAA